MKVSVIIPTKNEPYVSKLIPNIHRNLRNYEHEVIVVDLSEKTPDIQDAKLVLQKSKGLGNALLEGLEHASGDAIVLMDGDGSHRPEDLPKLIKELLNNDIVIGSRFVDGGVTQDKTHRKMISWFYRKLATFSLGLGVQDSMSGFSAVRRNVYDNVKLNPLGFKINMELVHKAKKKGHSVKEVPIKFISRQEGKSTSTFGEAFRILRYIVDLKMGWR